MMTASTGKAKTSNVDQVAIQWDEAISMRNTFMILVD